MLNSRLDEDFGIDAELEAECRVLGTLLAYDNCLNVFASVPLPAFCSTFHAAIYHQVALLASKSIPITAQEVWDGVLDHPSASDYGKEHISDLFTAGSPHTLAADSGVMWRRAQKRMTLMAFDMAAREAGLDGR